MTDVFDELRELERAARESQSVAAALRYENALMELVKKIEYVPDDEHKCFLPKNSSEPENSCLGDNWYGCRHCKNLETNE